MAKIYVFISLAFVFISLALLCFEQQGEVLGNEIIEPWENEIIEPWGYDNEIFEPNDELSYGTMQLDYDYICPNYDIPVDQDGVSVGDKSVALMHLKKFIANLLQREKLQYCEDLDVYQRTLTLVIWPGQLERLEQLTDPRALDGMLTEIFQSVQPPNRFHYYDEENGEQPGILPLALNKLKELAQVLDTTEVQFLLAVAVVTATTWFVNRGYFYAMVASMLGSILAVGYYVTYLECNRNLEVELMIQGLAKNDKRLVSTQYAWYITLLPRSFNGVLPQYQTLVQSTKIHAAYCRPEDVVMLYCKDVLLKQLECFLEECIATISMVKNQIRSSNNIIIGLLLLAVTAFLARLFLKYIVLPVVLTVHMHLLRQVSHEPIAVAEVHITAEDLEMVLKALAARAMRSSGVEEIGDDGPDTDSDYPM